MSWCFDHSLPEKFKNCFLQGILCYSNSKSLAVGFNSLMMLLWGIFSVLDPCFSRRPYEIMPVHFCFSLSSCVWQLFLKSHLKFSWNLARYFREMFRKKWQPDFLVQDGQSELQNGPHTFFVIQVFYMNLKGHEFS